MDTKLQTRYPELYTPVPSLTIELPYPPNVLNPNHRGHWAPKAAAVRLQRGRTKYLILEAYSEAGMKPPRWEAASVKITAHAKDRRRRDRDNLQSALKSAFDGAQDAGLIVDDVGFTYLPLEFGEADKDCPHVVIEFIEKGQDY